jgi:histidyl-tRNA synthetase
LDYYMRTTFEVVHSALGAQNSVLGGGRYDGLAEMLDSKVPAPGIGFSIGEDRLVMAVEESLSANELDVVIVSLGEAALAYAEELARALRNNHISVELATAGKLKRLIELADKLKALNAVIIGDNEIATGKYVLRNMHTGEQDTVSPSEICNRMKPLGKPWGEPWGPAW